MLRLEEAATIPVKGLGQNNAMGIRLVNRSPWKLDGSGEGGPEERAAQGGVGGMSVFRAVVAPQSLEDYVQDKRSALVKQDLCSNHAGSPRLRLAFKVGVSSLPLPTIHMSLAQHASSLLRASSLRPRGERALRCSRPPLINHMPSLSVISLSDIFGNPLPCWPPCFHRSSLPPVLPYSHPLSLPYLLNSLSSVCTLVYYLLSAGRIAMPSAADAADQEGRQSNIWVLPQILGIRGAGAGFLAENVREREQRM